MPRKKEVSRELLSLKKKTSWSWERMCREFHRVMGQEGPSHTTLFRYAVGKAQRPHVVTERYVREAIGKVKLELVQNDLSESETKWRGVEHQLQQTEIRFRELVENAKDLIYRYRLDPPGYEYINPVVKDMLGYTPEEFYANPKLLLKIIHPEDKPALERDLLDPTTEHVTRRWIRKDGRVIRCKGVHVPIYDEAGHWIAIEGIARDITEREQGKNEPTERMGPLAV